MMRILFIGDIVGRPGRELVRRGLAALVERSRTSISSSPTPRMRPPASASRARSAISSSSWGVDVMTSGNHIWDKKEAHRLHRRRAAAAPAGQLPRRRARQRQLSGADAPTAESVGVINVMGRVFMLNIDDPFAVVLARNRRAAPAHAGHLRRLPRRGDVREDRDGLASRRQGDGRVGTHTHVQTADERILPKGTAYLTDVGMTGPHDSVIGVEIEPALGRFLNAMPARFETATAQSAAERRHRSRPTRRRDCAIDIERLSYSLDELEVACCAARSPHERPVRSSVRRRRRAGAGVRSGPPTPVAARRVLTRHRADRPHPRSARSASSSRSGSRASSRTAASGTPGTCTSR